MRGLALLLLLSGLVRAQDADARLERLLAEDLDEQMRSWPTWATARGDRRFDDLLPDVGPEARARRLEHARLRLRAVQALDREALSPERRVDRDLLAYELERRLEEARFEPWQMPVTQLDGPQLSLPQLPARATFRTRAQLEAYVARLERVPAYLAQIEANLRAGLAAGRTPPRVTLVGAPAQALGNATAAQAAAPTLHPMWPPFRGVDRDDPLVARARRAVAGGVVPAFRRFGTFLEETYVPGCRESIAASDSIDGAAWYASRLRHHTTLDLDADAIHALGLQEVQRIRAEMTAAIARTDFARGDEREGDALLAAFVEHLRRDPRFYFDDERDLLAGYRDVAKRIDAWMPRLFGRLPRLPYGVRKMPPYLAPTAPTAYYYSGSLENGVPGYFVANTFRLDQRPRYEMVPLTLHEAVPGHHHQIALAQEMEDVPAWRSLLSYTAFGEGWALYAERLGLEMGDLLADPYDDFGRLSFEMWRALRLVVDTGLHAKGWSRERAIETMLASSALTRTNVEREVDRYIAWPGQATAYKIGELEIRALRARAEEALGEAFDLRAFHDAVLEQGSLPLPVLRARIERWIEARGDDAR